MTYDHQQQERQRRARQQAQARMDTLMHGMIHDPAGLLRTLIQDLKRGPRRCAYQIKDWNPVTGEIRAFCDPLSPIGLDPSRMVLCARWPWGQPERLRRTRS